MLQFEHGFSYGAALDGAFTLNAAIAGKILQAQIKGSMIVLRSQLSYEDIFKASQAGPAAFESATSMVVENMQRSFAKRQELAFWYGQTGLATVSSVSSQTLTITATTWAPGMWSGMKSCLLSSYTGITGSDTAHDAASGSGTTAGISISSVSMSGKTITISTSDTAGVSTTVAADVLFFFGSRTTSAFKECLGIDGIHQSSGTVFNISNTSYELWKPNSRSISGPLSMLGILNGISDAQNMGLDDDAKVYVPTKRWNSLNADQAALRRYGAYANKAENGSEGISYHSVNGMNEIVAHPFLKEGEAFLLCNPSKRILRVGSTDISFRRPGLQDNIFRELVDQAGLELRAFSDQAVLITLPAQCTKYTGITD